MIFPFNVFVDCLSEISFFIAYGFRQRSITNRFKSSHIKVFNIMEEKIEAVYTEIIEKSTVPARFSEIVMEPSSFSNNIELKLHTTIDRTVEHLSPELPNCSRPVFHQGKCQEGPITYKKAHELEDTNSIQYENVTLQSTVSERIASSDQTVSSPDLLCSKSEHSIQLCRRLGICKRRMQFREFACYAMKAVFEEVEKIAILDFLCFFISSAVTMIGFMYLDACNVCTKLPVMLVCSGVMDSVANVMSFTTAIRAEDKKECCRDVVRSIRAVTFLAHIYGLILVYEILYPKEPIRNGVRLCNSYVYWFGFSYFHLFTLTTIATFMAMIIASASYYF